MKCILWRESWETGALVLDRELNFPRPLRPLRIIETPRDPSLDRAPVTVTARGPDLPRRFSDRPPTRTDAWELFRVDNYGMGPAHYRLASKGRR